MFFMLISPPPMPSIPEYFGDVFSILGFIPVIAPYLWCMPLACFWIVLILKFGIDILGAIIWAINPESNESEYDYEWDQGNINTMTLWSSYHEPERIYDLVDIPDDDLGIHKEFYD